MMFISLKNKGNFEDVVRATSQKFSAVIPRNKPWPFGLRQISSLAALKCAGVEWLRCAHFAWRINDICQQRNTLELANGA